MDYENEMMSEQEQTCVCRGCGQVLSEHAKFCPICGAAVEAGAQGGSYGDGRMPMGLSKKEYRKKYAPAKFYKDLRTYAIIGYVMVGINVVVGLLANAGALADAALELALLLGMHLGKSKGCAIALLVYSIVNMILYATLYGSVGGWGWLALGIGSVSLFSKLDKQYAADMAS